MEFEQPKGPFCQSCGMPMENEEVFGTNANGVRIRNTVTTASRTENLQIQI